MSVKLMVSHEFTGMSDYWGGNGRRWDDNAGCLFAFYNDQTTLRDCVDQWVDEFSAGGDCDSFPAEITSEDVRAAILDSLNSQGRADYDSGALAECAKYYDVEWESADNHDDVDVGDEVKIDDADAYGKIVKVTHYEDGSVRSILVDVDGKYYRRNPEDVYYREDNDDYCESPVWIILVEFEICSECGKADEHAIGDICADCAVKHGYDLTV